jgi:uncharacterized protein (DUF885 family)
MRTQQRCKILLLVLSLILTSLWAAGCGAVQSRQWPTRAAVVETGQPAMAETSAEPTTELAATAAPPVASKTEPPTEAPMPQPSVVETGQPMATEPGVAPTAEATAADQATGEPAAAATAQPAAESAGGEPPAAGAGTPAAALAAKLEGLDLDEFFEVSFRELSMRDPEGVLTAGVAEIWGLEGAELTNISDTHIRETYGMYETVLEMLRAYDREALSPEQQISYDVYEWYLEDEVRGKAFMYHDYPATFFFVTSVPEDLIQFFSDLHPIASRQDAEDYVARLEQVDTKLDQLIEGLRLREEAGVVPPKFAIQWGAYGWRNLANSSATSTPFYQALEEKLGGVDGISAGERKELLASAEKAIEVSVLPAYGKLVEYLRHQESIATTDDGVWKLPDGEEYYAYALRHHTTTSLTADEIHELGLRELERIHAEMRTTFDELGYPEGESLVAAFDRVAVDGGRVSGNQVVEMYEKLIEEADRNLDPAFDIRPKAEVIVVGAPYGGYYVHPAVDGSRPGAFYAGVSGGGEDLYGMATLAYHEAIPGHHTQIAIAQEADLPAFRTAVGFTGYAEGWALYAERLAAELGWYEDDPYGNLGRLQHEAFRAARLVVDTGIHAQNWTFDEAEEFFIENVGFSPSDSVNPEHQIARYVVWPGQSTAYKIGMIKILELRQKMMDQLGDQFNLKEFHNVVLTNGSMPLQILERVVDDYIEGKMGS